jgi:hypothetical protein
MNAHSREEHWLVREPEVAPGRGLRNIDIEKFIQLIKMD